MTIATTRKIVVEGIDANTGGMSQRLQTRSDFDQYINKLNDTVIVNVNVTTELSVESMECNSIIETKCVLWSTYTTKNWMSTQYQ